MKGTPKYNRNCLRILIIVALLSMVLIIATPAARSQGNFTWIQQASGTTKDILGVSTLDPNHVWAVGSDGLILFYNGSGWSQQASPTTESLTDVSALDPNHVWAVDVLGSVLFYDGNSWSIQADSITDNYLYGIHALDTNHVWAVGLHSTVLFYDGLDWTVSSFVAGTDTTLTNVCALSADHVWAVGEKGVIVFYDGSSWAAQDSKTSMHLYGITAVDSNHAWACGWWGTVVFFDGQNWSVVPTPQSVGQEVLEGIDAASVAAVWAVGENGTILFFNGSTWTTQGVNATLSDVDALNSYSAWSVGWGGNIYYGSMPLPQPTPRIWAHDSIGVTTPAATWYLAEGCTGTGFETWILVQNPNDVVAEVSLTYMTTAGAKAGPTQTLAPHTRASFNASATVPDTWEVSTKVISNQPVIAERAMYGNNRTWAHDSVGVTTPDKTWYLAEGCTGTGFETWILVQNPNDVAAEVSLTYMTTAGAVDGPTQTLAPHTRANFNVALTVPNVWEVSTKVISNQPVVAERAMYGNNRTWAHDSIGVTTPDNIWYLAEGCTGTGFETWILVQNPNDVAAEVSLTYMTTAGAKAGPTQTLAPHTRANFNASATVPNVWELSTKVSSNQPVIAERAMYGNNRTWAHDSIGVTTPDNTWYLAEGCTGTGFETWILVQNPNDVAAEVSLTYMTAAGAVDGPTQTLAPHTRANFNVALTVPNVWEVSTKVISNQPVVAERAMYGG